MYIFVMCICKYVCIYYIHIDTVRALYCILPRRVGEKLIELID